MATYGTDLTLISDGTTGTVSEFGAPYALGNLPATDIENFIEGGASFTQETKNTASLGASIAYDNGSAITMATDDVVFMWAYFSVGAQLYTYANSGQVMIIGSSLTAYDAFAISGSDRTPFPYGGWYNYAVDPTLTPTTAYGGGSANHRYFGSGVAMLAKISKGNPHAVDAIRYGRGEIYCTGTACTFTGMAAENDDNATNQNRWGLFQDVGGSYLWKGLMSFGQTATSATFSHTGATIAIDDMVHVYSHFNKIEFNNASTDVTWNKVTFNSLSTVSPGDFEMIDDATLDFTSCTFNDMNTFIFLTNATLTGCTWAGCGQITHGGSTFDSCDFSGYEGTADTAYMTYAVAADPNGELDNCSFTKGTASTHAIEFDATNTPTTITLTGIDFSGYNATNGSTDSALYFPSTTKSYTVNLSGCTGDISYKVGTGGSVTLVQDPVNLTVTVKDGLDGSDLVGATVLAEVTSSANFPYLDSVTITGTGTTATVAHTAHGLSTNDNVVIRGADQENYVGAYLITVTGVDAYTYQTNETIITGTATGTITSTFALLNDVTDVNGEITNSWELTADQPFILKVRKATTAPFFIGAALTDTITTLGDKDITVQLTRDE